MMKKRNRVPLWCFVVVLLLAIPGRGQSAEFAVITNTRNPAQTVTTTRLRRLFRGDEKFWSEKVPVFLVIRESGSNERAFVLAKIYNQSEVEYKHGWNAKVFRGEAVTEPTEVPSNGLASGLVGSQVGGLTVLPAANIPKDGSVKVLKVDGKLPGEPGYPLRW